MMKFGITAALIGTLAAAGCGNKTETSTHADSTFNYSDIKVMPVYGFGNVHNPIVIYVKNDGLSLKQPYGLPSSKYEVTLFTSASSDLIKNGKLNNEKVDNIIIDNHSAVGEIPWYLKATRKTENQRALIAKSFPDPSHRGASIRDTTYNVGSIFDNLLRRCEPYVNSAHIGQPNKPTNIMQ